MQFWIIGPERSVLQDLKGFWKDKLHERRIRPKILSKAYYEAFEQYVNTLQGVVQNTNPIASTAENNIASLANVVFKDDDSPANKSSLSFLIESGDKRLLYLSDCHANAVISWLDDIGLEKIEVDAVKISHHGSKNNTSLELLKRIVCNTYLISTNGNSHGHPDVETLARIAVVNKNSGAEIFFNYGLTHIPEWFTTELETNYPNVILSMDSCEVDL